MQCKKCNKEIELTPSIKQVGEGVNICKLKEYFFHVDCPHCRTKIIQGTDFFSSDYSFNNFINKEILNKEIVEINLGQKVSDRDILNLKFKEFYFHKIDFIDGKIIYKGTGDYPNETGIYTLSYRRKEKALNKLYIFMYTKEQESSLIKIAKR